MTQEVELQIRLKNKSFANVMLLQDILLKSRYVKHLTCHISEDLENNIQNEDFTIQVTVPSGNDYYTLKELYGDKTTRETL